MRPLIKPAIELIELAMQMSKSTYLFPANGQEELATNGFDTTIPNNVKIWARRSLGIEMEHWSMHDLRRTMRTRMSAITTQEVAELMIGHSKKGWMLSTTNISTWTKCVMLTTFGINN